MSRSSDPERLNYICVANVSDQAEYFETRNFSSMIGNFQTSKSFNIQEREYRSLWPVIKIECKPITKVCGVSSVLKTEWNNTCVANVSDKSARKYKENFPLILKNKAICTRFSDLVILNTVSSKFRFAVCKCWFWNRVPWFFFKFYRPTV